MPAIHIKPPPPSLHTLPQKNIKTETHRKGSPLWLSTCSGVIGSDFGPLLHCRGKELYNSASFMLAAVETLMEQPIIIITVLISTQKANLQSSYFVSIILCGQVRRLRLSITGCDHG